MCPELDRFGTRAIAIERGMPENTDEAERQRHAEKGLAPPLPLTPGRQLVEARITAYFRASTFSARRQLHSGRRGPPSLLST
jgi:hypothetical protein